VLLSVGAGAESWVNLSISALAADSSADVAPSLAARDGGMAALSTAYPSSHDQYLLELINRGRADPAAEAVRYETDLNEGLATGTISADPKQPLAFNLHLVSAAQGHSQWMLDSDTFNHYGPGPTDDPGDRMAAAGYTFIPAWGWGENIAWRGTTGTPDLTQYTELIHSGLYVDANYPGRGHRLNLMAPAFKEIGTGAVPGVFTKDSTDYNALMVTEDFAYTAGDSFLTGVAYDDVVADDDFYSPGEGLGGITIVAAADPGGTEHTATTWSSGGYTLQLSPGTYDVRASGPGLGGTVVYDDVVIGSENVKLDFTPDMVTDEVGPRVSAVTPAVAADGSQFVRVDGTGFVVDGGPFFAPGTNNYYLMQFAADPAARGFVDEVLQETADLGLKTVRTWGFWEPDADFPGQALQTAPGVYSETTFVGLDYVVHRAGQLGLRLIIPFVNFWDDYGGMDAYVAWDAVHGNAPYATERTDFYTDADTRGWYKNHVATVLNRVNTFTGVAYKDDPTIMAWELANEPRNVEGTWSLEPLQGWIEEMAAYVKSIDSNHLLSTGAEGFYFGRAGDWKYNGWMGCDFVVNHNVPEIDFATVHAWPQNWSITNTQALTWIDEHIIDAHATLGKPLLIEEFGQFRDASAGDSGPAPLRNELYQGIFDRVEANDVAGWNTWILCHDAYPDYDHYGVYYPADTDTLALIAAAADALNQGAVPLVPTYAPLTSVDVTFDEAVAPGTVNGANILLVGSGGDRSFGDANDVAIAPDAITLDPDGLTAHITIAAGLPDDLYRLTLVGTSTITDVAGNPLDGEFDGAFPSGDGASGGDFVALFTVETFAAPGTLDIDTDPLAGGRLNPDAPAPHSLGILGLDPNGNPPHRLFAIQIGTDPNAGWLRFESSGPDRRGAYAVGTEPEWHVAGSWQEVRLRDLTPGTAYTFRAKASDGRGNETGIIDAGTFETNIAGDVNRSGLASGLDYALAKVGVLLGEAIHGRWHWSYDVNDDGVLDALDLGLIWNAALAPPPDVAPAGDASAVTTAALAAAGRGSGQRIYAAAAGSGSGERIYAATSGIGGPLRVVREAVTPAARLTAVWSSDDTAGPWEPPDPDGDSALGPPPDPTT